MTLFFLSCAVISTIGLILCLLQAGAVCSLMKRKRPPAGRVQARQAHPLPPVSILKPLRGLDDKLFDNLSSFCTQDYPMYEILFSLQDHNDPAYKVAQMVQARYPDQDITIVVERCNSGLNPKVNNLIPSCRKARHPYILISDSNVTVGKNYLREIVRHTEDPAVGLVSNVIRGVGGRSIGAILENLHLNSFILGSVSFLDRFLGMPCVIGKSMLMKKEDLEALGGLEAFKDILAEDFVIGREMHRAGKKVVLSNYMISNVNEYWGIKRFLNRHTRWGKLRWKIGGFRYFSELLANPVFVATLPVILEGPSRVTLAFAAIIGLIKVFGDSIIGWTINTVAGGNEMDKPSPLLYILAPIKDIIIGIVWFVPIISSTVVWRGHRYLIGKDSRLSPCPETGFWSWGYRITDVIRARFA
ncbi:MAG TPA: ceramide glucosyltransferase [Nitrospirota bacterium]|nr:ceramide glucosyltransferase [Nitrospirota bacterium]